MDRFETDAREMCLREHVDGVFCEQCIANEAALRETDAKAREEERERWKLAILATHREHESRKVSVALNDVLTRTDIRKGAGECGTCPKCDGVGSITFTGVPNRGLAYRKHTSRPCPACQGGDGAEVVCHMCGGTFPPCHECSTERGGFHA